MAGTLIGTNAWFADPASQVSAHYGIGLKGEVVQYVDEKNAAWANGQVIQPTAKIVLDNLNVNQNKISLSIEHEGQDLSKGTEEQLNASAGLLEALAVKYGIPLDRTHVIGHYEIKATKPNCPATNKSIIDEIISRAKVLTSDELVPVQVPKSKVAQVLQFISTLK